MGYIGMTNGIKNICITSQQQTDESGGSLVDLDQQKFQPTKYRQHTDPNGGYDQN